MTLSRLMAAAALSLAGCTTDANRFAAGPFAYVNGRLGASVPFDSSSVTIVAIDGVAYFDDEEERRIQPGLHVVEVMTTRGRPKRSRTSEAPAAGRYSSSNPRRSWTKQTSTGPSDNPRVYVDAKPCMRYHIVAHHTTGAVDAPWKAELTSSEPIQGCRSEDAISEGATTQ